jgi:pyruvate dehydrogenase E2 component (dihydrolipoyllysine-residue acetyltransferase)
MAQLVNMPKLGFDMAEGTLVRWVAKEGEAVSKGAVLAEIETDKATVEVESAYSGVVLRQLVQPGVVVPVNEPIAVIGEAGEDVNLEALIEKPADGKKTPTEGIPDKASKVESIPAQPGAVSAGGGVLASPLARSMAAESGIDIHQVRGTGPGGRITKKDIQKYQATATTSEAVTAPVSSTVVPVPPIVQFIRETRSIPLPKLRAAIGRRMLESMQQAPHFYVTHEYNVADLLDLRGEINALLPEDDKLSVNDFIVRAIALTLLEFPNLNASLDLKNNALIYYGEINIGVAVAVENGLLTVVNRNTDQKSVHQISNELKVMVKRAREMKVRPEDIEGSTFTVSNMGMYDVDQFTAIINPPEAAILAVGSAKQVPMVANGEIKIGVKMKATLSIDHRISDGAEGARFMQALAKYLEEPLRLMI